MSPRTGIRGPSVRWNVLSVGDSASWQPLRQLSVSVEILIVPPLPAPAVVNSIITVILDIYQILSIYIKLYDIIIVYDSINLQYVEHTQTRAHILIYCRYNMILLCLIVCNIQYVSIDYTFIRAHYTNVFNCIQTYDLTALIDRQSWHRGMPEVLWWHELVALLNPCEANVGKSKVV